ncbi:MAG: EpsG family protein [Muribaculaceae bacterium]|nr:EpsG family protein [Muribaculaceae bacterium]
MTHRELFIIIWTLYTIFICLCWIYLYNQLFSVNKYRSYYYPVLAIVCVFGVFGILSNDFFNYARIMYMMQNYGIPVGVEIPYLFIAQFANFDNITFRACIFIPATIGLCIIFKKYSIKPSITVALFFILFYLNFITTVRSSFADVFFFLGALYFIKKKNIRRFLIFLLTTTLCCFFHDSGFMLLLPFLLALPNLGRNNIKIYLYLLPLGIIVARVLIGMVFSNFFDESGYVENTAYLSGSWKLRDYMYNSVMFSLFSYTLWKNRNILYQKMSLNKYIYQYAFFVFYIWIILYCSGVSRYVASRFLFHNFILLAIFFANSLQNKSKQYKTIVLALSGCAVIITEFAIFTTYRDFMAFFRDVFLV